MENYNQEFQEALKRSQALDLWKGDLTFNSMDYIAEWLMYELGPKIAENFSRNGFAKFLGQPQSALKVHHLFKPIVDDLLKVESIITTGFVKVPNDANEMEEFGKLTDEDIKSALDAKVLPEKIHNWLTLPSGEIIDLSFMTMYGLLYHEDSLIGNIVAKASKNLTGGMEYHPVLLGEAFYEACHFDFDFDREMYLKDEEDEEV